MKEKDVIDAYLKIRSIDNTIPDEVLNFMKLAAIEKLKTWKGALTNTKLTVPVPELLESAINLLKFLKDIPLGVFEETTGFSSVELHERILSMEKAIKKQQNN